MFRSHRHGPGHYEKDSAKSKSNIYETITAKIIAAVEANPGDPVMPWLRGGFNPTLPVNATTQQAYRGINILSLWVSAFERGFESGEWATLKQWVRRVSRMKGVTNESMSSVQLCRRVPRAVPATAPCEAGTKAQGGQPAIGEIRARRRSDG